MCRNTKQEAVISGLDLDSTDTDLFTGTYRYGTGTVGINIIGRSARLASRALPSQS